MNKQDEKYYKRKLEEFKEQEDFDNQMSGCIPLILLVIFFILMIFTM